MIGVINLLHLAYAAAHRLPRRGVLQPPGTVPTVMLAVPVLDDVDDFVAAIDALVNGVNARPFEHYVLPSPPDHCIWHAVSHQNEAGGVALICFREMMLKDGTWRVVLQVHGR